MSVAQKLIFLLKDHTIIVEKQKERDKKGFFLFIQFVIIWFLWIAEKNHRKKEKNTRKKREKKLETLNF